MALEDYLPTTQGAATPAQLAEAQQYATPNQLASMHQYANLLMKGGQRDQPITSPWQGARMMADALSGNVMRNRAGQQQTQSNNIAGQQVQQAFQPPGGGQQASLAPQGAGGLDPQTARTFKLESGNNPNNVTGSNRGLAQFSPDLEKKYGITNPLDPNQQASGMHQETAENSQGLAKALGRQPSPGEIYLAHQQGLAGATALLTHPNMPAWQAIRPYYSDEAARKKGFANGDAYAMAAIRGNPPGGGHFDPNAPAGAFSGAWISQFERGVPHAQGGPPQSPTGGQTADLSGGIGGTSPQSAGSPQVMAQALAANGKGAPPPTGMSPQMPQKGSPEMGSQYMQTRPVVDPGAFQRVWSNPYIPQETKDTLLKLYMEQNQPVSAQGTGGTYILPHGGRVGEKPLLVPDLQKGELDAGGIKAPYAGTFAPGQDGTLEFHGARGMPGIEGTPQAPPPDLGGLPDMSGKPEAAAPPGGDPSFSGLPDMHGTGPRSSLEQPATASGQASPMGQIAAAGAASPQASAPAGVKTASLGDGAVQSSPPQAGGMLSTPPPQMAAPTSAGQPSAPAGPQVAQASGALPSLGQLRDFKLNMDKQGDLNKEDVKKYTENSNALMQAGTQAQQGLSMLKLAQQAVKDPKYYSGIGANAVLNWKQLKAAIGDDPNAAAAMEVFKKSMAGDVLGQLRSKLQGLGQVRLAEIDLLSKSTANEYNTPAANSAVLNIIERGYNQMGAIAQITDAYSGGARLDSKGNWIKGNDQPTNAGLNEVVRKYLSLYPTFTTQEIKDFNKKLDLDDKKPPTEPTTYTNSKAGQAVQPAAPPPPDNLQLLLEERARRQGK